jgi:hypothetical protein
MIGVPLLREGEPIGVIALARTRVEPFVEREIELVETFADQAVIAIENARLLNELRQSLQQQTATAKVLQVISDSTFDLQTVLRTLVEYAARLCEAHAAAIWRPDGGIGIAQVSLRSAPLASRAGSTMPLSARCRTSPPGYATRPSRDKSSSVREC